MKPNFALGMSQAGVTLWQRASQGWLRVGAVALDHPDIEAAFAEVVATARKLEPGQILTKLVIPDDQILYCQVHAPATDPDERRAQIRAGLAGRTPFPVEELDFDWTGTGPEPDVAVVARETLVEAEEFAKAQGLNPVCFVAAPANGIFAREPFFGPTRCARSILGDPDLLERDDALLRETGIARLEDRAPKADAKPEAAAPGADKGSAATAEAPKAEAPKPDAVAKPAPAKPKAKSPATATGKEAPVQPADPTKGEKSTSAPKPEPGFPRRAKNTEADEKSEKPYFAPNPKSGPDAPALTGSTPEQPMFNFKSRRSAPTTPVDGSTAAGRSSPRSQGAGGASRKLTDRLTAASKSVSRGGDALSKARSSVTSGVAEKIASAKGRIGSAMQQLRAQAALKKSTSGDAEKAAATPSKTAPPAPAKTAKADSKATPGPEIAAKPASSGKPAPGSKARSTPQQARPAPDPKARPAAAKAAQSEPLDKLRALATRASGPAKDPDPEAEKLTIFGARGRGETELSGQQRVLLVGGGLVAILLAAAVWAFYFTRPPAPEPELAEMPPPELGIERPEEVMPGLGMTEEQAIEDALAPPDALDAGVEMEAQAAAPEAPEQPALLETTEAASTPDAEALQGRIAGLRSTGLVLPQDMAALPQVPDAPPPFDADALPPLRGSPEALALQEQPEAEAAPPAEEAAPEIAEAAPAAPESALPPGEEALEITVTPGSPSSVPPEKPVRFTIPETPAAPEETSLPDAPAEAEVATDALQDESQLEITVTPGTPPVIPPARPVEQMPEADEARLAPTEEDGEIEQAESAEAPPPGGLALAALRPEMRPDDWVEQRLAESPEPVFEDLTPQAVANSLRPAGRPSQFAAIVERTMQAAPAQTAAAAAPRIPSSASVSREATQARAINLRQVNLIGVMGTPSNRRALVRLSNGRVVTVRVGENLDGGTVTAISETELRYNRRGRDVVLRFPS